MTNIDKTMNEENEQPIIEAEYDEELVEDTEDSSEESTPSVDDLRKQIDTLKAQKDHWKSKANSAPAPTANDNSGMTQSDIIAIAKSDIHDEDIERVTKFAKMEGISVKDALGHDDMKAILERRSETRRVASASNTKGSQGSTSTPTGETLAREAASGRMPDPDQLDSYFDTTLKRR